MKLAVVTCYKQPDYIRAQTLRQAAAKYPGTELYIVKNSKTGAIRYLEIIWKLIKVRFKHHPDVYLLTFRGYEILPMFNILTWPKAVIYDEFINPIEWLQEPRTQRWVHYVPLPLLGVSYRLLLRRCKVVLADTEAHAKYSASINKLPNAKTVSIPVGTNEVLFTPNKQTNNARRSVNFQVFYYGNMLPLHGLSYVLGAANLLKALPIEFVLVGGGENARQAALGALADGSKINYRSWVDFNKLPDEITQADLCLGGPFGGTIQAQMVITGKTYQFMASAAPTLIGQSQVTSMFKDKVNCLCVPQADAKELAIAIKWAYENQPKLQLIGQKGYELYLSSFSQKVVNEKFATMLKTLF